MVPEDIVITENKGQTIIESRFLKTALIDVKQFIAQKAFIKNLVAKKLHIDTEWNIYSGERFCWSMSLQ